MIKNLFKVKSLKEKGVFEKLAVSFALMSLIPLLLTLYIIYIVAAPYIKEKMDTVELVIFLMICASVAGYLLSRGIIRSIVRITKDVKVAANGDFSKRVETSEVNEVGELAMSFNRIIRTLEHNIEDLKESKTLLQNVLHRIGSAMTSARNIDSLLELIVETLKNALGAESGVLMLIDEDKNELFVKIAVGIDKEKTEKTRIKVGEGIVGWVAKEGEPLSVSSSSKDHRFDLESKVGYAHKSHACVPLIYKGKTIGTLSLNDKRGEDNFTEDDVLLLSNLAAQTAVAVENSRLNEDIEQTYFETITALALAVEAKDPYSRGHSKRVTEYVTKIAHKFNLDEETIRSLRDAAVLHDIGKIGVKDEILLKPSSLTPEEMRVIRQHAVIGESILKPIHSLSNLCYLVRHHQERVDGEGYPDGLKGEEITLPLRILIVADAFDAMTSDRPYRKALSKEEAKAELKKYAGIYFGEKVVEAFIKLI